MALSEFMESDLAFIFGEESPEAYIIRDEKRHKVDGLFNSFDKEAEGEAGENGVSQRMITFTFCEGSLPFAVDYDHKVSIEGRVYLISKIRDLGGGQTLLYLR